MALGLKLVIKKGVPAYVSEDRPEGHMCEGLRFWPGSMVTYKKIGKFNLFLYFGG